MRRLALLITLALAPACGDDDDDVPVPDAAAGVDSVAEPDGPAAADAATADAPLPDAGTPDAGPSFSGTISIQEVTIQGIPQLGQGLQVTASFRNDAETNAPVLDEMPGSTLGCKVWEYTPAEYADVGLDEGVLSITAADGDPVLPPCAFVPTRGYVCIGGMGTGGTIALVNAVQGLWSYTDAELTDAAAQVGRYLAISGATMPANNGTFPIVSSVGANTVVFVNPNPTAVPETVPAAATWTTVAGAGPIPGTTDPGFLEDNDELTVELTSGGDGHYESFTRTFAAPGVGDDFTLDTASQSTITDIPTDGTEFTLSCAGAGGSCGTSIGTVLTITTTDGVVPPGAPPYYVPPPATKVVEVRCAGIGTTSQTVPAAFSAYLMSSGATRIRTAFLRSNLQTVANTSLPQAGATIVAGHGVVGFTTP